MNRPRLIPVLLLKNGLLMRSQLFRVHQAIGNPIHTVMRLSDWNVDELILLDISTGSTHDLRRDDLAVHSMGTSILEVIQSIAKVCFMPLSVGGRIRSLDDIQARLSAGADKCILNSIAVRNPSLIAAASKRFGAQCVVVSMDAKKTEQDKYEVFIDDGKTPTGLSPSDWAYEVEQLGAGEIFLNSIDRDGSAQGYDIDLIQGVTRRTKIPVVACGGVGKYADFAKAITQGGAHAASAANIFHFYELSYPFAKQACIDAGVNMRPVELGSHWFPREPHYDRVAEDERLKKARSRNHGMKWKKKEVRMCTQCVYPAISAAPMEFDSDGVCMGCRMAELKKDISENEWSRRRDLLIQILEQYRCRDGSRHDCVIPVSGGKDSYFQTHVIKNELGFNPLLVTYNGNNYTDVGWRNLLHMKEAFGVDHIIYSPSVSLLKKLNRLGFYIMGDMNWHAHVGITTLPIRMAVQHRIPLLIWGEHGYLDLCGQFSLDDFPEMSYRDRLEHFARGFEWNYMVGRELITSAEMVAYQYPSDQELFQLDLRGIYLGNYVYWEANEHTRMVIDRYGFETSDIPFDRTYRRMSNLDDMHENGVHDYMKYIKFGYGRCTDHACKDIRAGEMSRQQALELVPKMDPIKPRDLERWLDYAQMSEEEFDRIADSFRDPRAWEMSV